MTIVLVPFNGARLMGVRYLRRQARAIAGRRTPSICSPQVIKETPGRAATASQQNRRSTAPERRRAGMFRRRKAIDIAGSKLITLNP